MKPTVTPQPQKVINAKPIVIAVIAACRQIGMEWRRKQMAERGQA